MVFLLLVSVSLNEQQFEIDLFDTAGQEDYDRMRPLSFPGTHVALICYSVVSPASFENIETKWLPEIRHHLPKIKTILVGTKLDLREDSETVERLKKNRRTPVTHEEGEKLAKCLKMDAFCEASAKTQKGLKNVFETAISCFLDIGQKKKKRESSFRLLV